MFLSLTASMLGLLFVSSDPLEKSCRIPGNCSSILLPVHDLSKPGAASIRTVALVCPDSDSSIAIPRRYPSTCSCPPNLKNGLDFISCMQEPPVPLPTTSTPSTTTTTTTTTTTESPTFRTTTTTTSTTTKTTTQTTTTEPQTTTTTTTPTTTTQTTTTTTTERTIPTTTTISTTTSTETTTTTTTTTTPTTTTTHCTSPNLYCDCDSTLNLFLQGICKNAFSLICRGADAEFYRDNCPSLVDGTVLECNSATDLCDCPYGVVPSIDKMACVGPDLMLEPSVLRTVISGQHGKMLRCNLTDERCCPFCYPELNVTSCTCNETSDVLAMPTCFCNMRTPKSIRCIDLECVIPVCEIGYQYDPIVKECIDVDECGTDLYNDCDQMYGHCLNDNGTYHCACSPGFLSIPAVADRNQECVDVDECAGKGDICGEKPNECLNIPGSYRCHCHKGSYFAEGTCIKTAEVKAYDQACSNRMAYKVNTILGPECKCLRTFYKNQAGFCVVGSHVYEFVLGTHLPFASEYRQNDTLEYQQLAQLTEQWTTDMFDQHSAAVDWIYRSTFQRAVADRFEISHVRGTTDVYVTLVFDTKQPENSTITIAGGTQISEAFFNGILTTCGGIIVNSDCLLDRMILEDNRSSSPEPPLISLNRSLNTTNFSDISTQIDTPPTTLDLRISAPDNITMLHWHLLDPCLRPSDHNCLVESTLCSSHAGYRYAFACPCRPGFKALSVTDHRDQCVDINECLFKPSRRPCQPTDIATCTNTIGGFECGCPDKYRLTNTSTLTHVMLQCIERDRCKDDKNTCGQDVNGGTCYNTGYPGFNCSCFPGYILIGDQCLDLNECEDRTVLDICADQFAQCVNKRGSFECQCSPGFYRDRADNVCKISAHAYTIKLRLAMPLDADYSDAFSTDFRTFSNDTQTVLGVMFQNESQWPCVGTKFLDSQVAQITRFGESYVDATIVMNFDQATNSSVDCPIKNVTDSIRTRIPDLCDAENHLTGGTCALEGTSLRVPIVTRVLKTQNNTVNRTLPDHYDIVGETIRFGCDEANDCSYRHFCEQVDAANQSVYPYNCKCKEPYMPMGKVDNKEICLDACSPSPCHESPCEYRKESPYYTCNCLEGYYGVNCSDVPCSTSYCYERGKCMVVDGRGRVCECDWPYSGVNCEKNVPGWLSGSFGGYAGVFLGVSVLGWLARHLMMRNVRKNWWPSMQPPKVKLI